MFKKKKFETSFLEKFLSAKNLMIISVEKTKIKIKKISSPKLKFTFSNAILDKAIFKRAEKKDTPINNR
jgi:hypothetical protein